MPLQTTLDTLPASSHATLITFRWGVSNVRRYVRWTENLAVGSEEFAALPEADIDFGAQHGGAEDVQTRVTLPMTVEPVNRLVAGHAWAATTVDIEECDPYAVATTRRLLYSGRVVQAEAYPNGRSALAALTLAGPKSKLKVRLGILADTECAWRFGDRQCGINLSSIREQGTVVAEVESDDQPLRITVVFQGTPDLSRERWDDGYFEVDGLRIMIRRSHEDGRFDLARKPPPTWFGQPVIATPGCGKSIEDCRYWNNESRHGGLGYAMPSRNPVAHLPA